jgi:predicted NBD/HSP70 family sugar kinase
MALRSASLNGPESGTNLTRVKDYNEVVVLDLVRSRGELTRPAIAEATGLTLQTVSNIARRLLDAEVVIEHARPSTPRRRTLKLNPDAAYALGIQLDRTSLAVAVVDLAGQIKARATRRLQEHDEPATVVAEMARLADRAIAEAGTTKDRILGAGIGAPGPLDLRQGRLLGPLSFTGWDHFPLRDVVSEALDLRVLMDNDATAAALGEQWRGLGAGTSTFVYLYLGRGLGSGVIVGGQAFRGHRGNAGEISHVQVDPAGPPCPCGANGCLGLYATPDGLLREARKAVLEGAPAPYPESFADITPGTFPTVIANGARHLARVVVQLTRILDPELIVLGGPLTTTLGDAYAHAINTQLAHIAGPGTPAPRVESSRIGADAGVIGAATLVLHDLYAPTMGKLSL